MNKTYAAIIIVALLVIQLILVVNIYFQDFLSWEGQSKVGLSVAAILFLLAIQLIVYDKAYGIGRDRYVEWKVEEEH
ncbi:MAG: hypothetical protein RXR31_06330 [Thermoproteota archaeon]|jgi:hypothetical protein